MSNIKLVTLKNNNTYLADIMDDPELPGAVVMKEPLQIIMVPPRAPNTDPGLAFVPFLEFCEEFKSGIVISPNDVLTITTPITQLLNQYNQMFGSGSQIANNVTPLKPVK